MTPDLLEAGAQRLQARTQGQPSGQTAAGGQNAGFARVRNSQEVDVTHGRILYLEDVNVSFDGFKAINCAGRAALHHRPQRCGQDDHDGHHHRQDPARFGHRVFWQHH